MSTPVHLHVGADIQCREVAIKCWEVGDEIRIQIKGEDLEAISEAIGWLHRSLNLIEWLQKQVKSVEWIKDLNIAVLRSLGESTLINALLPILSCSTMSSGPRCIESRRSRKGQSTILRFDQTRRLKGE